MIFRKENEYIIEIIPQHLLRLVCIKVKKNVKGEIESYTFNNPVTSETSTYLVKETNKFLKVIEPIDNLEMFKMYVNWLNFKREGLHENLVFAKQISEKISNILKERSYVMYGAGSWVDYDFRRRDEMLNIEQIEDNPSVIDAVEKTVEPVASTTRLQKAIKKLQDMSHEEYKEFLSKHKNIPIDANTKPWKYATHCLKADETSIFICNQIQQILYIDGSWQPSSVYHGILKEIETEHHDWLDPEHKEYNTVSRKDVESYQRILDEQGLSALDAIHTDLGNSNSMGAIPSLNAIAVVMYNNNLMNFGPHSNE